MSRSKDSGKVKGRTIIIKDDDIGRVFPITQIERHIHQRINLRPQSRETSRPPPPPRYPDQIKYVPSNSQRQNKGSDQQPNRGNTSTNNTQNNEHTRKNRQQAETDSELESNQEDTDKEELTCNCDDQVKEMCKSSVSPMCNCDTSKNDDSKNSDDFSSGIIKTRRFSHKKNSHVTIKSLPEEASNRHSGSIESDTQSPRSSSSPTHQEEPHDASTFRKTYQFSNPDRTRRATNYFPEAGNSPDLTQVPSSELRRVGHPATLSSSNAPLRAPINRDQLANFGSRVSATIGSTIRGAFNNFNDTFPGFNNFSVSDISSSESFLVDATRSMSSLEIEKQLARKHTKGVSYFQIFFTVWLSILTYFMYTIMSELKAENIKRK